MLYFLSVGPKYTSTLSTDCFMNGNQQRFLSFFNECGLESVKPEAKGGWVSKELGEG